MSQDARKRRAAEAAIAEVANTPVLGVGSGTTVHFFIALLADLRGRLDGAVASSEETARRLREARIPVLDLNEVGEVPVYVDGADEATRHLQLVKGGGGALTREKILAEASRRFVCIIDDSKLVGRLGDFPLAVEVIPMARGLVARRLTALGGRPILRAGFTTDNGHPILDVHNLHILEPAKLEGDLNQIPGVVANGIFARRRADLLLVAGDDGVDRLELE